jgi:type VI secretion system protein ImpH
MRTAKRRIDPGVIGRLLDAPYRFEFFQAVRLLELLFGRRGKVRGDDVLSERVAFRNTVSLSFPPSEIAAAEARDADGVMLEDGDGRVRALEAGEVSNIRLTPAFFGLLGAQGALPHHYTEVVVEREVLKRDHAARAFFDIFSNRATALFYLAWKKYRLPFQHEIDRGKHYLPALLALAGVGEDKMRGVLHTSQGRVFDESIGGYVNAVRQRPLSASYLQQVLSDYFRTRIRVEQFVGKWYRVPEQQYTRLGDTNAVLGLTALAGERVWQRDLRVRLWVGPLTHAQYAAFLPGADSTHALKKMLTLLGGATLEYEIRLILRKEDVASCTLENDGDGRLGWDTFLCSRPETRDRSDACYDLETIH